MHQIVAMELDRRTFCSINTSIKHLTISIFSVFQPVSQLSRQATNLVSSLPTVYFYKVNFTQLVRQIRFVKTNNNYDIDRISRKLKFMVCRLASLVQPTVIIIHSYKLSSCCVCHWAESGVFSFYLPTHHLQLHIHVVHVLIMLQV